MDILFLLVPLSVVLVLAILGVFAWALHHGQFDDLEREGERLLQQDDAHRPAAGVSPVQTETN
jgi:cbb3-type cytochrome oxidase maturation protein